jgi:hypothetical protein
MSLVLYYTCTMRILATLLLVVSPATAALALESALGFGWCLTVVELRWRCSKASLLQAAAIAGSLL